jgi:hypothetical protein
MSRSLRTVTIAALCVWSAFWLYIVSVVARLATRGGPADAVSLALLWPLLVLAACYWIGFRRPNILPERLATYIEAALLTVGLAVLILAVLPRAVG